jgi:hypothetical protein
MKSLATAICLLAGSLPFLPVPNAVPLEVRIDIKPRTARGIIPVRTMPYHASATISEAGTRSVIGTVNVDLQPGQSQTREESVAGYRITFQSKIATDGLRAAAVATVWKGEQIVTRQSSDVSLER